MTEGDGPHPDPHDLAAFDAGTLAPVVRSEVERHVATCADCCRTLDSLPDDDFVARVRALAGTSEIPSELADHPRYRVLERLGAGGMGVVYRATHRVMNRAVALKVIHRRLSDRPDFVEQFRREVQAVALLAHPNIVTAHDADRAGDLHFLVMEQVEGITLDRLAERDGPLPIQLACECVRQTALGLQHAHERGMVHRDVKPGNIILTPTMTAKVLDFGLARLAADEVTAETASGSALLVGTPDYVAPEQARDPGAANASADVYGLGCTLYFLLTGQPPFPGGTVLQKLLAHQDRPPQSATGLRPDVPRPLAGLIERMLAKNPAERPPTAAAVAEELLRFTQPVPARPVLPRRATLRTLLLLSPAALAAVAALLVVLHFAHRDGPQSSEPGEHQSAPEPAVVPAESPADTQLTKVADPSSARAFPGPPLASTDQVARERTEMRNRAADWLRANCRGGPDSAPVTDSVAILDRDLSRIEGFQVAIGARLLKSARPTLLVGRTGGYHAFELTPERARDFPVKEGHIWVATWATSTDVRRASPRVLLSDAVFDNADELLPGQRVTGSVSYRVIDRWAGESSLRLNFRLEKRRRSVLIPKFRLPESDAGTIPFLFPSLGDAKELTPGPIVLFVEVTTKDNGNTVIESSAAAGVVRVAAPEARKP